MRISNVNSRLAINTILARFIDQRPHAYRFDGRDITVFAIDECDHCGKECEGANPFTIVNARNFVIEALAARKLVERDDITEETGCNDDGDCVCPTCYAKGLDGDKADKILLEIGEGGAG